MKLKNAKSIPEQIDLLRNRGMIIDNESQAYSFLESNHYYRLNIYFHKFMVKPNCYDNKINFTNIISIYENDSLLRNNILFLLERIEVETRTHVSHYLALTYGPDAFYNAKIFKSMSKYKQIYNNFNFQISRNKKDPVILHHNNKYGGKFPIWVIIEYLSFNTISKLYNNLLEKDKKVISKRIHNVNDHLFGQWLHVLSIQRNICAHYGYLFRRIYAIRPIIAKSFNWNKNNDDELFSQFLVMKQLTDRHIWNEFVLKIVEFEKMRPCFNLADYGFPNDWKSYLL